MVDYLQNMVDYCLSFLQRRFGWAKSESNHISKIQLIARKKSLETKEHFDFLFVFSLDFQNEFDNY